MARRGRAERIERRDADGGARCVRERCAVLLGGPERLAQEVPRERAGREPSGRSVRVRCDAEERDAQPRGVLSGCGIEFGGRGVAFGGGEARDVVERRDQLLGVGCVGHIDAWLIVLVAVALGASVATTLVASARAIGIGVSQEWIRAVRRAAVDEAPLRPRLCAVYSSPIDRSPPAFSARVRARPAEISASVCAPRGGDGLVDTRGAASRAPGPARTLSHRHPRKYIRVSQGAP